MSQAFHDITEQKSTSSLAPKFRVLKNKAIKRHKDPLQYIDEAELLAEALSSSIYHSPNRALAAQAHLEEERVNSLLQE